MTGNFFLFLFIHISDFPWYPLSWKRGGLASSIPRNTRPNRTSKLKKKRLKIKKKTEFSGGQWWGLCTPTSGGTGWIPGRGLSSHKPHSQPHGVGAPTAPPWPKQDSWGERPFTFSLLGDPVYRMISVATAASLLRCNCQSMWRQAYFYSAHFVIKL